MHLINQLKLIFPNDKLFEVESRKNFDGKKFFKEQEKENRLTANLADSKKYKNKLPENLAIHAHIIS